MMLRDTRRQNRKCKRRGIFATKPQNQNSSGSDTEAILLHHQPPVRCGALGSVPARPWRVFTSTSLAQSEHPLECEQMTTGLCSFPEANRSEELYGKGVLRQHTLHLIACLKSPLPNLEPLSARTCQPLSTTHHHHQTEPPLFFQTFPCLLSSKSLGSNGARSGLFPLSKVESIMGGFWGGKTLVANSSRS